MRFNEMVTDTERVQRQIHHARITRAAVALTAPLLPAFAAVVGAITGVIPTVIVVLCAATAVVSLLGGFVSVRYATEAYKAELADLNEHGPWPSTLREYNQRRRAITRTGLDEKILITLIGVAILLVAGMPTPRTPSVIAIFAAVFLIGFALIIWRHRATAATMADLDANYHPAPAGE